MYTPCAELLINRSTANRERLPDCARHTKLFTQRLRWSGAENLITVLLGKLEVRNGVRRIMPAFGVLILSHYHVKQKVSARSNLTERVAGAQCVLSFRVNYELKNPL